ncbi:MAG: Hsp20/alpha crystallin family protein [Myxococcota bacterium]
MATITYPRRFDPVSALQRLQEELERVFENPIGFDLGPSGRGVFPPVNVLGDDDGLVILFEVPGIPPENLNVQTRGRTLTVTGKREPEAPASGSYHRRERWSGEFSRSLSLPDEVDPAQIEARYEHGVLRIRVPRREEAKPRQITVQTQ